MKLILTKFIDQHMPFYATEILIAQKRIRISNISNLFMIIVQNQAPGMNAKPRKPIIFAKRAKHVFSMVRIPLFFYTACKISYCTVI